MRSTSALFLIFSGSALAFAPASRKSTSSALKVSPELQKMVGASVETGNKIFDPLNLSDQLPPSFGRAAELANGRAAMLATVGYVFPKYFGHFPGSVTTEDPIAAIFQADPQWWAQFLVVCATIEGYKYRESLNGKSFVGGGEPVLDWARKYPKDETSRRDIELKELKNGRLAMIGIAGFVAAHYIPGSVPIAPGF